MKRKLTALLLIALMALTGCYEGEVTKRDKNRDGAPHILVDDGTRERWVKVDKSTFDRCQIGKWYDGEKCLADRPTMRNIPVNEDGERPAPEVNERPRSLKDWEYKDRNSRRVCFHWIIVPRQEVEIVWWVDDDGDRFVRKYGNEQKCVYADRGAGVGLTITSSDELEGPKMVCEIHQETARGRRLIDFATGLSIRKCTVSGRVT